VRGIDPKEIRRRGFLWCLFSVVSSVPIEHSAYFDLTSLQKTRGRARVRVNAGLNALAPAGPAVWTFRESGRRKNFKALPMAQGAKLRFPAGTSIRCHDDHWARIPITRVPVPTVPIPSMPVAVMPVSVAVAAIVVMIVAPVRLCVLPQR
jgi:hypothetical protein